MLTETRKLRLDTNSKELRRLLAYEQSGDIVVDFAGLPDGYRVLYVDMLDDNQPQLAVSVDLARWGEEE